MDWKLYCEFYHVVVNALKAKTQQRKAIVLGYVLLFLSRTDLLTGLKSRYRYLLYSN